MTPSSSTDRPPQRILIFEQKGRAVSKVDGIRDFGGDHFEIDIVRIEDQLPEIIDDTSEYLPDQIDADLVLDFLVHPDLSTDLGILCTRLNIPVVASGKKSRDGLVITPPTCCGLEPDDCLGEYGKRFGAPEFEVTIEDGIISDIHTVRGAPCGSSWEAAAAMIGMPVEEAIVRIGVECQFYCSNDPAGWDPIYGESPVHYSGKVHSKALKAAVDRARGRTADDS